MKSIFRAVFVITIFSLATRVLGFLFRIYLSRSIGAEGMGVYQIVFSVFAVLESVIASGLPLSVSKTCSKFEVNKDTNKQSSVTIAAFIISIAVSAVVCLVVILFKPLLSGVFADPSCASLLLLLLPALFFTCIYAVFRGYLWGKNNLFLVGLTEFIEQVFRIAACVALFYLLPVTKGASGACISFSIACLISAIFVLIFYFIKGGRIRSPKGEFKPLLKSAIPITGVRVASNLLMPAIAIIIPLRLVAVGYTQAQALAQYGIAMGMTFPLLFLPSTLIGSLAMAIIPEISYNIASKNNDDVNRRIQSSIKFTIFISACFIPLYIGLGVPIGEFLYNNSTAGYYLASSAWLMIPLGINNISTSILNSLGLEAKGFINYIIGAVFLILAIIILPKYIGIMSLVWGMGLCMTAAAILNIRLIKKHTKVKTSITKDICLLTIFSLPCSLLASWGYGLLTLIFPSFVSLIIAGSVATLLFLLLCNMFKIFNIFSYVVVLTRRKKRA